MTSIGQVGEESTDTIDLSGAKVTFVPMDSAASYSLTEWDIPPGWQSPPIHVHRASAEGFYVLAGQFGFVLDGVTTYARQGAHVLVPSGHPHSFWNAGPRPAKCLLIVSPPGLEQYFRALAAALGGIRSAEASLAARMKLSEKYDMEVVGPFPDMTAASVEGI